MWEAYVYVYVNIMFMLYVYVMSILPEGRGRGGTLSVRRRDRRPVAWVGVEAGVCAALG